MKQTRFIPTNDCGLQLREPQEGQQESREIEGRPIVFGVPGSEAETFAGNKNYLFAPVAPAA